MPKGTRPQSDEERYQARLTQQRGRAKTLLNSVQEEMRGVPNMPSTRNISMGGDSLLGGLTSLGVAINDGIRTLQGKDTSKELQSTAATLRAYLRRTNRLKESLPPSPDSLTSPRSASDVPRRPSR